MISLKILGVVSNRIGSWCKRRKERRWLLIVKNFSRDVLNEEITAPASILSRLREGQLTIDECSSASLCLRRLVSVGSYQGEKSALCLQMEAEFLIHEDQWRGGSSLDRCGIFCLDALEFICRNRMNSDELTLTYGPARNPTAREICLRLRDRREQRGVKNSRGAATPQST